MCTQAISVRGMAKFLTCRVVGFVFSERAKDAGKFEAKYLSTESQGFGSSQHKSQSQKPLAQQHSGSLHKTQSQKPLSQQHSGSLHKTQSQKPLTQQHRERMELQNKKTIAKQTAKHQSQGSESESLIKIFSEFGGLSKSARRRKRLKERKEAMRKLEGHSDKLNSEGREIKHWMEKQSQESQIKSQVKMDSESGPKQLAWNEVMRILKAGSKGDITLSDEQQTVLKAVSRGQSVFVTGSAGTGKSYLLDFVVKILRELHSPGSVFVTASTGIAACHLNGMTLHSFSGAPPCHTTKEKLSIMIRKKEKNFNRWLDAKALIIDEISMIDGEFFDQLNYVANELRKPLNRKQNPLNGKQVWGGLQLVVTGDFFQLPPVNPPNPDKFFAFQADCWNECFDKQIELTRVFRQSDRELVEMLQDMRRGRWDQKNKAKLDNSRGPSVTRDESVTRLYPRNEKVREVNDERLKALKQEIITFTAKDKGEEHEKAKLKSGIAPDQIDLCVGAQVMLIKNIETGIGLVNGAMGQIVEFVEDGTRSKAISPTELWPKVRFLCGVERIITPETWNIYDGEEVVASRRQVPLILAWAVTVHKCQGMTLERLETDLSKAFDYGMVYVALSRVKNLDGLRLKGFKPSKIKAHPKVLEFYEQLTAYLGDKEKE